VRLSWSFLSHHSQPSNVQSSIEFIVRGCEIFTRQFYLAVRFENGGLQQVADEVAAAA